MSDIAEIHSMVRAFSDKRDWSQFHNGKDLALALSIESSELNELFLWKKPDDVKMDHLRHELADVFYYAFLLASHYNLDINEIIQEKLALNEKKYPVDKSKGSSKKYTEL